MRDEEVSVEESYWKHLPKIVVAHATFQKALSGEPSESALAFPIQSYLGVKSRLKEIKGEENHPSFDKTNRQGRTRQIDFVGVNTAGRWSFALETKMHSDKSDWSRLVQDFVKVLLLYDHSRSAGAQKLLLVVFPIADRIAIRDTPNHLIRLSQPTLYAERGQKEPADLFCDLLPWNAAKVTVTIPNLAKSIRNKVDQAVREFGAESIRDRVTVKLLSKDWSSDFACGLWALSAPSNKMYRPDPRGVR
jgi:hypothetical protein